MLTIKFEPTCVSVLEQLDQHKAEVIRTWKEKKKKIRWELKYILKDFKYFFKHTISK